MTSPIYGWIKYFDTYMAYSTCTCTQTFIAPLLYTYCIAHYTSQTYREQNEEFMYMYKYIQVYRSNNLVQRCLIECWRHGINTDVLLVLCQIYTVQCTDEAQQAEAVLYICISMYMYMYMRALCLEYRVSWVRVPPEAARKSDCLGCAVLLCLVCLFDLACFFLSSFSSLI